MTNPLWLILLICLSPLGAVLIILVVKILINWNKEGLSKVHKSIFILDERELESQGPFWLSILIPILYFFHLGYYSWENHHFHLSGEGIKLFFEISKMPLTILSVSVPASILISRMHASKQTAKQMQITEVKNNIDLFNAHREDLFVYFDHIAKVKYLDGFVGKFNVHAQIHKNFFSGTKNDGAPITNNRSFNEVEEILNRARENLLSLLYVEQNAEDSYVLGVIEDDEFHHNGPSGDYYRIYRSYCSDIEKLAKKLFLSEVSNCFMSESKWVTETFLPELSGYSNKWKTIGNTSQHAIAVYRYIYQYYESLCQFSGDIEPNKKITQFFNDIDSTLIESEEKDNVIEILHKEHLHREIKY